MAKSSFFDKFNNNKSKYFQFINNDVIESQVISYNGTIIPLPRDWAYKKVSVTFHDGLKQEMYVKDNGNICYITCAKIYLGTDVVVRLKNRIDLNNLLLPNALTLMAACVYLVFSFV